MNPPRTLRHRLAAEIPFALRARDRDRLRVLRTVSAALDNAEAVPLPDGPGPSEVPRRDLSELEVVGLVRAEVEERERARAAYDAIGETARAAVLAAEVRVLRELLDDPPVSQRGRGGRAARAARSRPARR